MMKPQPKMTIIPPDGREIPFERRYGTDRLRGYSQTSHPSQTLASINDRRSIKRQADAFNRPRQVDLEI